MVMRVDITVASNGDFRREFAMVDEAGALRSDLYLSRLRWQVRTTPESNLVVLQADTDPAIGGLKFTAPVDGGRFVLRIPHDLLDRVAKTYGARNDYVHDLVEITPFLLHRPLWSGTFKLTQGVTR